MSFFSIAPATDHVVLDPEERTGSVVFSVQNKTGARRRVRGIIMVDDPTQHTWYSVREPVQEAGVDETIQFQISVAIPASAEPGGYTFRLRAVAEDDPDDVYRDSQSIRVQVSEGEQKDGFPWWVVAIVVAVLVVGGVLAWVFTRDRGGEEVVDPPPPEPTEEPTEEPVGPFPFGLQVGETQPTTGTTSAADSRLPGVVQNDTLRNFFVARQGEILLTGVLQDRVTRSTETGTLIFSPRIRENTNHGSNAVLITLILSGFEDVAVDPEFRTDGLGDKGPSSVSRSDDGDELHFDFSGDPLAGGQVSLFLSVFTETADFAPEGTFRVVARALDGEVVTSDEFPLHVPAGP